MYVYRLLVSLAIIALTYGSTTVNVSPGVYSLKAESDGLQLPIAYTFTPITALTARVHISRKSAVFVHYQLTIQNSGHEFWSKLQIRKNHDEKLFNAGAIVHISSHSYSTPTGYWMDNLDPGHYTLEIHYKSPTTISVSASTDWQTAILQVMWFEDGYAVNDGLKCPNPLNRYNVISPIRKLETEILSFNNRVVFAAYQMSVYCFQGSGWFATRMHMNNEQLSSTAMISGYATYLDNHGLWMKRLNYGKYYFGVSYWNNYNSYFEDCQNNYEGNTNLFTMQLPPRCTVYTSIRPTSSYSLSSGAWRDTDLSTTISFGYTFTHVIIRYQFVGSGRNTYTKTRLLIGNSVQKHTMSMRGNSGYANNAGMWQGVLPRGSHSVKVQHYSGSTYSHSTSSDHYTRALDIVYCY